MADNIIGKLTGYRCRHCGACMYMNGNGAFWCSSCDYRSHELYDDIKKYAFAPVPESHPHIELFGGQILHEALATAKGKG